MLPPRLERLPSRPLATGGIVHEATTRGARLLGLAFLDPIPYDHGLWLPDCRSVHTFGMRFELDVAFLDERGRLLRLERRVSRRRILICRRAFGVLEARAGHPELFVP